MPLPVRQQFSLTSYVALTAAQVARRLLDRHAVDSYSQTGEDRVIEAMLQGTAPGFYVDVGCHHPTEKSNTFRLYKAGWRGLVVDADPDLVAQFGRVRPRDIAVCAAVADTERQVTFTRFEQSAVNSFDRAHVERYRDWAKVVDERSMTTRRLTDILNEHGVGQVDLLSVDVEGADLEALRSFDWSRWQPKLVVAEMHGFDLEHPDGNDVYQFMRQNGYRLASYAVMNGYFLRS